MNSLPIKEYKGMNNTKIFIRLRVGNSSVIRTYTSHCEILLTSQRIIMQYDFIIHFVFFFQVNRDKEDLSLRRLPVSQVYITIERIHRFLFSSALTRLLKT